MRAAPQLTTLLQAARQVSILPGESLLIYTTVKRKGAALIKPCSES